MDKAKFVSMLNALDLPSEDVYEDMSEIGTVLWHNYKLSVKIVETVYDAPCMQLVFVKEPRNYLCFECNIDKLNSLAIATFLKYAKNHADSLCEKVAIEDDLLVVVGDDGEWKWEFNRA